MNWRDHIGTDPNVLVGKPCIKGTRLSVEHILKLLASGWPEEMILKNHPRLTRESLQAVFAYASDCLEDGLMYQPELRTA